jgi:hypothetical protein
MLFRSISFMPKISFSFGLSLAAIGLALGMAAAAVSELSSEWLNSDRGSGRRDNSIELVKRCNGGDCRGEFPERSPHQLG